MQADGFQHFKSAISTQSYGNSGLTVATVTIASRSRTAITEAPVPPGCPAGVASHELSHAAKACAGQSGQLERVIAAGANAVREAACAAGPGYLPVR